MAFERRIPAPQVQEQDLNRLGQLAREAYADDASELAHAAGKRRLRAALTQSTEKTPGRRWVVALPLAAMAAVAAVLMLRLGTGEPAALSFEVAPEVAQGSYLQPPLSGPPAQVRFSDGTQLTLDSGSRARIATTTADGAQLVLERGHAELHVVHRPGARWSFDAGPFVVAVTGTRFTLDWSAEDERLQVVVTEGSVRVQQAGKAEGVGVTAGQQLLATARDGRFELGPIAGETPPSAEPPAIPSAAQPAQPADSAPAVALPAQDDSWSKRVAAGDFKSVLSAAQSHGLASVLAEAPLTDLVALADAARYTGSTALAESALLAQRSRFPSSSQARTAAFLMGRIAEDQERNLASALSWYDSYLKESPQGAFAAEALGRRLVLLERTAGPLAARDSAQNYLRRFPSGPYARVAQQILAGP